MEGENQQEKKKENKGEEEGGSCCQPKEGKKKKRKTKEKRKGAVAASRRYEEKKEKEKVWREREFWRMKEPEKASEGDGRGGEKKMRGAVTEGVQRIFFFFLFFLG